MFCHILWQRYHTKIPWRSTEKWVVFRNSRDKNKNKNNKTIEEENITTLKFKASHICFGCLKVMYKFDLLLNVSLCYYRRWIVLLIDVFLSMCLVYLFDFLVPSVCWLCFSSLVLLVLCLRGPQLGSSHLTWSLGVVCSFLTIFH